MSVTVTADDASRRFTELLELALAENDEIVISRSGEPVARLVPVVRVKASRSPRVPGTAKGLIPNLNGFDDPLPVELLEAFEG